MQPGLVLISRRLGQEPRKGACCSATPRLQPGSGSRRLEAPTAGPFSRLLGLAFFLGLSLVGCGGTSSPSPVPTPTPNLTTTLPTISFSNVDVTGVFSTDVNVTVKGSMTVVGDWTFATDDVDVYVTDLSCNMTEARLVRQFCTLPGKADTYGVKPKRLTMNVAPAPYRVFVANFGPTAAESGTLQISITSQP